MGEGLLGSCHLLVNRQGWVPTPVLLEPRAKHLKTVRDYLSMHDWVFTLYQGCHMLLFPVLVSYTNLWWVTV